MPRSYINAFQTIPEFLTRNARIRPNAEAYRWFDHQTNAWVSLTWAEFSQRVRRWRKAMVKLGLRQGDRVAMLLPNSIEALLFDQAAQANGLVVVPLHAIDAAGSSCFILNDSGAQFLVTVNYARWNSLAECGVDLSGLKQVVLTHESESGTSQGCIPYCGLEEWLATGNDVTWLPDGPGPDDLSALVYTSGTTGRPKGVMLTHRNIVSNVQQCTRAIDTGDGDVILSFLPLSHTFERTVSYYLGACVGAKLAISRGVAHLAEDLKEVNPTMLCTVPRVLERFHASFMNARQKMSRRKGWLFDWAQEAGWRRFCRLNGLPAEPSARAWLDPLACLLLDRKVSRAVKAVFGKRMRILIAGGAALNYAVSRFFCGMGVNVRQGYGLTESSPVVSVSGVAGNHPATVGEPLPGLEVRLGANDELQVRGPQVMQGYEDAIRDRMAPFTDFPIV
ncbi:MAG: AMP-binding protein, partial [Duodenibacillus sp.]|nr:AMP-binding protein [Duodenibacillus sp.]